MSQDALLARLHGSLRPAIRDVMLLADRADGIRLVIVQGFRSHAEQRELWLKGRDPNTGRVIDHTKVVTKSPPGYSYHEYGLACDLCPLGPSGTPWWGAPPDTWTRIGEIGESRGLEWGGRWVSIIDRPHFQWRGDPPLTLADVRAGKRPTSGPGGVAIET